MSIGKMGTFEGVLYRSTGLIQVEAVRAWYPKDVTCGGC